MNKNNINFPSVLAFSVHEMKNSLSTINDLVQFFVKQDQSRHHQQLAQLEFEANRMNNSLIQLLILYKIGEAKFSPNIDEYLAIDVLKEAIAQQASLLALNNIELEVRCSDDLLCYCDMNLISNGLSTVLNNAQRYSNHKIILSATQGEQYVVFDIEDDGAGYPQQYLTPNALENLGVNLMSGSTGLGLYFVAIIAKMHQSKGHFGHIDLSNASCLGGAKFSLFLP